MNLKDWNQPKITRCVPVIHFSKIYDIVFPKVISGYEVWQTCLFQASQWCNHATQLLVTFSLDQCNTLETAQEALQQVEAFLATGEDLKLTNPREFRQMFDNMITPDTRVCDLLFTTP